MPSQTLPSTLEHNLSQVRRRIAEAAVRAGRDPFDVQLVGVTKTVGADRAAQLFGLGLTDLGENRADDLAAKAAWFRARDLEARWHFVGHIQRNKARLVVEHAAVIHSVDSLRLLDTLERLSEELDRRPQVYVQVMVQHEITKTGFEPGQLREALLHAQRLQHVRAIGLMAMGPLVLDDHERRAASRDVFAQLAQLARTHADLFGSPPRLSMGMSEDFELAIAAGSDVVRVGTALFADVSAGAVGVDA